MPRRFAFAALIGLLAAMLHWAIFPITQSRVTFIFFIPAMVLTTIIAGRWPGALVAVVGLINSAIMKTPGTIMVPNSAEQLALIASAAVSVMVILVGGYYRSLARRELSDLHELHELSTTLASIPELPQQLELILATFVRMHDASMGMISVHDPARGALVTAASVGFGPRSLDEMREVRVGELASGQACLEKTRVVIDDTESDPRFARHRDLARSAGFRAVHATPLIGLDGQVLGTLSVYLEQARRPSERELRIADICARKASVFIERARAEENVRQRDRRFQAVLEAAAVPFIILSPVVSEQGKIVDFRFRYINAAAAKVMRVPATEFIGRKVLDVMPRAWDDRGRLETYIEALERNEVRQMERQSEA
ncbi:MAG TPA: GAF domain-containing protein, partial [Steroidobacteraceae bacterium]|nr:GAF domain-containing protein [Steroidobacteraceae bacterium]